VYVLLDYGDFIDGSTSNTAAPYVQLLATTDAAAAHADFGATRLDTTDSQQHAGSTTISGSSSGGGGFSEKYKIPTFSSLGCGRSGVLARGVARSATSDGGVPTAV
jgi:hypothetical protein